MKKHFGTLYRTDESKSIEKVQKHKTQNHCNLLNFVEVQLNFKIL